MEKISLTATFRKATQKTETSPLAYGTVQYHGILINGIALFKGKKGTNAFLPSRESKNKKGELVRYPVIEFISPSDQYGFCQAIADAYDKWSLLPVEKSENKYECVV